MNNSRRTFRSQCGSTLIQSIDCRAKAIRLAWSMTYQILSIFMVRSKSTTEFVKESTIPRGMATPKLKSCWKRKVKYSWALGNLDIHPEWAVEKIAGAKIYYSHGKDIHWYMFDSLEFDMICKWYMLNMCIYMFNIYIICIVLLIYKLSIKTIVEILL